MILPPPLIHPLGKRLNSVNSGPYDFEFGISLGAWVGPGACPVYGQRIGPPLAEPEAWKLRAMPLGLLPSLSRAQAVLRIPCSPFWEHELSSQTQPIKHPSWPQVTGPLREKIRETRDMGTRLEGWTLETCPQEEWPLFLFPFWHLSPSMPSSSKVCVLFSCPDCAPNTRLPSAPYSGLCFLFSFQALHDLTLVFFSGLALRLTDQALLRGHYSICHGFSTCQCRLLEHMALSCPGGKGQEQHEFLDSPWVHIKPFCGCLC